MYLFARNHNNDLVWLNLSYFVIKVENFLTYEYKSKINWQWQKQIIDTNKEKIGKIMLIASRLLRERIFNFKSSNMKRKPLKVGYSYWDNFVKSLFWN